MGRTEIVFKRLLTIHWVNLAFLSVSLVTFVLSGERFFLHSAMVGYAIQFLVAVLFFGGAGLSALLGWRRRRWLASRPWRGT